MWLKHINVKVLSCPVKYTTKMGNGQEIHVLFTSFVFFSVKKKIHNDLPFSQTEKRKENM